MLERKEVERYGPPGFHLAQKEEDYVQHWVLSFISRTGFGAVFKGGTCLQKCFGLPRYSEDLDFALREEKELDMDALSAFLSSAGFSGISWKRQEGKDSASMKLRVRGPLYNGAAISECTVVLELSRREKVLLKSRTALINSPYPDMLAYEVLVMELEEMAAEKVRALLSRSSARDLFDLYFLLRRKTGLEKGLVEEKLRYYDTKFDMGELKKSVKKLEKVWKTEISSLTPSFLAYDEVSKAVLAEVKRQLG